MSGDLLDIGELQEELRARAGAVSVPGGLALRAAQNAHRVRTRRRVALSAGLVIALAVVAPLLLEDLVSGGQEPVQPAPTVTPAIPVRWTADLPGLELPIGDDLAVAYAVGGSVTPVDTEGLVAGNDTITQLIRSAPGQLVVVARPDGLAESRILVLQDQEPAVTFLTEPIQLSGSVVVGTGWDGQPHIAYAVDGPEGSEVFAGPVLAPAALGADGRFLAAGFLNGEPVFASRSRPSAMTQFHTASQEQQEAGVERELVSNFMPGSGAESDLVGWWEVDDGAVVFGQGPGCTSASSVPGFGFELWSFCDDGPLDGRIPLAVGPVFGAAGASVHELGSKGHQVQTFDLPQSTAGDRTYELEAIGWETATDVIIRVVAYESPNSAVSTAPAESNYVAVRCSVETGACERLPHPVDVMAGAINPATTQ